MQLYDWQKYFFFENARKYNALHCGRRVGKTHGAAVAAWIMSARGSKVLWVDVVYKNINMYFNSYFKPILKEHDIDYHFCNKDKILTYKKSKGFIVFGSADRPELMEGQDYNYIFINEAGIILKNKPDLYDMTLLPMTLQDQNSQVFAVGTAKGKYIKKGKGFSEYYNMAVRAMAGDKDYQSMQLPSNVNPKVSEEQFQTLLNKWGGRESKLARQEIFGEFVDFGGDCLFSYLNYFEEITGKPQYKMAFVDYAGNGKDHLCMPIASQYIDKWYIEDVYYSDAPSEQTEIEVIQAIRANNVNHVIVETNGGGVALYNSLVKEFRDDRNIKVDAYFESKNKEERIVEQKLNVLSFMRFREMGTHGEMYDLFLQHILAYETMVKDQIDDAPDAVCSLSRTIFDLFQYLYMTKESDS